jgi:hypothetical protein
MIHSSKKKKRDPNDSNWITLRSHVNDTALNGDFSSATWTITTTQFYRFFRIILTGKNASGFLPQTKPSKNSPSSQKLNSSETEFILSVIGFDLYGTLQKGIPGTKEEFSTSANSIANMKPVVEKFKFHNTGDHNGIISNLGPEAVKVTASSMGNGKPIDFIARNPVFCWTKNEPNSWFCVDFGPSMKVLPTTFSLGYGSTGNRSCPRNFQLQASNTYTTVCFYFI